ncbi:XRE family transcriptional regulator [Spongiactinospora rosea]|uniref:XRE family transcriptional regulator n=1 Tax=Spongiactinospora rosea TaxID=2248750 RepID=A0A366LU55_9ACTN|nr:helix-turn-helix transcriptional regulator [Spongiactinospora rosea]RBQ17063.1 XRE family transcriptional regulator [Spongiactinospora rosea]
MSSPVEDRVRRIGENVRIARRARGKSVEALAGLVGRSKSWLSKIENGRTRLDKRTDIVALAEALEVSADFLLGHPAPEIRPNHPNYNLVPLQRVLMDAGPDDPPDMPARPVEVLRTVLHEADMAFRRADDATLIRILPDLIGELYVHIATSLEPVRSEALKMLILAAGCKAAFMSRGLGEVHLAYLGGERGWQAAELLGDPVWRGAAAFGRAHARCSAGTPKPLLMTPRIADEVELHIGDDLFAHQVHGMLRLSAALACEVLGDRDGAAGQVGEAARLAEPLGDAPDAFEYFGVANVGVWRTTLEVEAGRPGQALEHANRVDPRALPSHSRRAMLLLERARAHAMLDRDEDAVRELRKAEQLSPSMVHNHPFIKELVADILDRRGGRDVRGLAWRMNLV